MSVFVFSVDGNAVAGVNIPDADKARILAAYATLQGYDAVPTGEPAPVDEDGKATGPAPTRPLTEPEMWQAIAGGWLKGTLANVARIEEEEARKATPTVAPISFTPISA